MKERISINNGYLSQVTTSDLQFVKTLFSDRDVKTFYVLRPDHAADISSFVQYMIDCIARKSALNYIICDVIGQKVGLISAELNREQETGEIFWNVGYAIAPQYRRRGYATNALNGLTEYLLNNFSIQKVSLDISEENNLSKKVAEKCGFRIPAGPRMGYYDVNHMELGMRFKWVKSLSGKRVELFNKAASLFRMKNYAASISYYKLALNEAYVPGTPFTDAQIYSNMGIAYSASRQYQEAFRLLKKAKSMGLNNAVIEKELKWLRDNVGLY